MLKLLIKLWIFFYVIKIIGANSTESILATAVYDNFTINNSFEDDFTFFIVGGDRKPAIMKYAKHMVSIRSRNPHRYFGDNHFCAGTIISKSAVLTSAHCVMDKRRVLTRPRRLLLVAGTPNRLVPIKTTVQFPAKSISAHTNFIRNNENDIAIIHLKGEIPMDNENVQILKMASGPPAHGAKCAILGWGRMIRKGPLAALPLTLNVYLYSKEQCKQFMHKHFYEGMLCAGDRASFDEDPCRGDSGGPLICNGELTGVISWTIGCGTDRYPSLYTDVWYHRDWIAKHLNKTLSISVEYKIFFLLVAAVIFII